MAMRNAKIFGDFYSPERTLSYHRPWIFSVGSRSIGKSTGWGIVFLKDFLDDGKKFIYVRRTDDELMVTCKTFFDSAVRILKNNGYNIASFEYRERNYWVKMEGEDKARQCGTVLPLSQEQKYKSTNYEEYWNILYDEFISADPNKYLGSKSNITYEYDRCLSLYESVDRGVGRAFRNETRFVFLGNNSSYFNPLFIALGIDEYLRTDTKICAPKDKLWIVEQTSKVKATEKIEHSFSYQLSNEKNRDYAFNNLNQEQKDDNFVMKLTNPMRPLLNMKYRGHLMGVYIVDELGKIYICNKTNNLFTLAMTCGDQDKINYLLAIRYSDSEWLKIIKKAFYNGDVIFENRKCKYEITNYFMLTS